MRTNILQAKKALLVLFAMLMPLLASAQTKVEIDGIWYNLDESAKQAEATFKGDQYYSYNNEYSGSITLPATVTYNGVTYSVTSIGHHAFYNCSSLTAISIPESVTSIGYGAFEGCSSLTAITIPEGVTRIGDYAFDGCSSLNAVHISSIEAWCKISFDGNSSNPLYYAHNLYLNGELVTELVIPSSVTSIGNYAFSGCIENYAFAGCSSLATITCNAATPPTIDGSYTFNGVDKSIPVYVPAGSEDAYKAAEYWSEFTNIQPLSNEYALTVSSAGYATLYLDYAAKIPDNVKAYIGTRVEGNRLMMTQVTGVLPANTGVIVRAEAGTYIFEESKDMPANVEGNLLSGTATDTYITAESGYKYYVLAQKDGLVAMYRPILTDGRFLNNANKAYIALDTNRLGIYDDDVNTDEEGGQLSNSLRFDFGGTTIIENPLLTIDNPQIIYDLHGRRVTDTEGLQGIYIIDGCKVVIK